MKEYKIVSIIFENGLPDMDTVEEIIPLVVLSKEDIEAYIGKEISDAQFNKFKEQVLDENIPDGDLNNWLSEEMYKEFIKEGE